MVSMVGVSYAAWMLKSLAAILLKSLSVNQLFVRPSKSASFLFLIPKESWCGKKEGKKTGSKAQWHKTIMRCKPRLLSSILSTRIFCGASNDLLIPTF